MIRRIMLILLTAALVLTSGGYLFLWSSLPRTDGRIFVRGLTAPVRISRDAAGVPLIEAANDEDAAFGLGFAHAQDRLFQMELMRRLGAGRLAEIFGVQAAPVDRLMRVLGLYRAAAAETRYLSPALDRALDGYAAGVNAYMATHRGALPPEFALLRFRPQPWRPADSLVWGKLIALELGGDWRGELLRARMAHSISPADMRILFPHYPEGAPTTLSGLQRVYRALPLSRLYAALPAAVGPTHASNSWVVDGRHSASGKPLLANDPHLPFGAPDIWYLARLRTPQREIAGATVAGVPFVVVGHNDRIAWGFTTTGADIEDLFVEKLDPADKTRYLTPDGSAPFETRAERILVRGGKPIALTVRATRHGPVISDALPPGSAAPGHVLSLAATFLGPEDKSAQALWGIDRAQDWAGFRAALRDFVGPPQNIVYADSGGTIGFIVPGLIPIRRGKPSALPVPGWTGADDWTGFIPFEALPSGADPPSGRFIAANNRIVPKGYPYFIGRGWDLPNRAERIAALLDKAPIQSPRASAAIEADTYSLMAARLVPLMTRITPANPAAREAVGRLEHWNFQMDRQKVAPLLFTAWLREFARAVLFGRFGDAARDYWGLRPQVMEAVLTKHRDWCKGGCAALLAAALDRAIGELRARWGPDMATWNWGRAHMAVFVNPVYRRVPLLRGWLTPRIATSGGYDTLDRGPSTIEDDRAPFAQRFGAGLRIITDLAAPREARMMIVPGQSGNPLSRHFSDLLRRWRDVAWLEPGRAPSVATLTLLPQPHEAGR
ncbi:MAG TPA: penicillin acylase family protein [Stellaceae bacterium]|nr:penicillin acylase family protein [Stellaceae bacterium]